MDERERAAYRHGERSALFLVLGLSLGQFAVSLGLSLLVGGVWPSWTLLAGFNTIVLLIAAATAHIRARRADGR